MALNRRHNRLQQKLEIDMTPIMDLVFMLLIVFVITVPILDYTSDVTPPKMTTDNKVESTATAIFITLDNQGNYTADGVATPAGDLDSVIRQIALDTAKESVILRADQGRPLEEVVAVMRAAKNAGLKISLMTQAE
ncbi:MAG: biopolymer transporter ExbD [Victivallales bacterium]|nr:biopolymer transporter ExbD [Victivallales bacterium]